VGALKVRDRNSGSSAPSSVQHDHLQAPDRIRVQGRLAGSDAIVGLAADSDRVWRDIEARLASKLHGRWQPVAGLLRPLFDSSTIKPLLSALSRGAGWEAPIVAGGRQVGEVVLDARLDGNSFAPDSRHPADTYTDIEFEAGAESQATSGAFREGRWRATGGMYIKGDVANSQYQGTLSGYGDSLSLAQIEDGGRVVAKTKTVEPGVIFSGRVEVGIRVKLDGGATPKGQAADVVSDDERHTVDVGVTVSVPRADCPGDAGNRQEVTEHYAPPSRITRFQRFGSTDAIWDFHLLPADSKPAPAERLVRRTVQEWTSDIDQVGAEVFGPLLWDRVARQIESQIQPGTVHQRLKEMGSEQPIEIHGLPSGAAVEVSARVTSLEHVRGTGQTEFTSGTEVRRRNVRQVMTTKAGTAPVPGQDLGEMPGTMAGSGAVTGTLGHDHMRARAVGSRTGMQSKAKVQGEVFDGIVQLRFKMRYSAPLTSVLRPPREAVAKAHAGVRVVIERAECVKVKNRADATWKAGPADLPNAPETAADLRSSEAVAVSTEAGAGGLPLPADQVWPEGLPDTSVILDLWGMERLRGELRQRLSDLAGDGNWTAIESVVLGAFDRNRLMANLAAMTRGTPMEGPDLPHPIGRGFRIAATATVRALMFSRHVPKVELAPQADTDSQLSTRHLDWWALQPQGQLGHRFNPKATKLLLATFGGQLRHRTGWRLGVGGQAVTNAKFNVPMAYFSGLVRISFSSSIHGRTDQFHVTLPFMTGLPAGSTRTLGREALLARADRGESSPVSEDNYRRLAMDAAADIAPATGLLVSKPKEPGKFAVPERVQNGRLSRSDFILSVNDDSNQLVNHILEALGLPQGGAAARLIRDQLDTAAVKPQIPGMTNGDAIRVEVSGTGWSGHLSVTAVVREMTHRESVPKVEFENGSESYTSLGLSSEERHRRIFGMQYKGKFPHTSLSISGIANRDTTLGLISDTTGRVIGKGKTVEAGALLEGKIEFHIDYRLQGLGRPRVRPGTGDRRVAVRAVVMVPERDMRMVPGAGPGSQTAGAERGAVAGTATAGNEPQVQLPSKWFAPPERIQRRLALSSSDIVLDVWSSRHSGGQPSTMTDILRDSGLERRGREVFGRSWPRMVEKILAEVDLRRLHYDLKAMTAGHPITVDAPPGVAGRVLITARLSSARQVSATAQTEFNVGTSRSRDRSSADPRATTSASRSKSLSVQVLGSTDPTGHLPHVQAGPTFMGYLGRNDFEFLGIRTNAGMTMKVKAPGVVYDGVADLHIRLESRQVKLQPAAQLNVRFLSEQDESEPVANQEATVFDGPSLLLPKAGLLRPSPADALAPPRRVWGGEPGKGLSDTDVIRGLPGTGGLLQALDAAGKDVFGTSSWRKLAPVMRGALGHASLAAGLPAMTRGEAALNPLALRGLGHQKGQMTARARIVGMRYLRTSSKAEMNPVNELTSQSTRSEQYWWQGGLQIQAGPVIGPVTMAAVLGGLYRRRDASVLTSTGRVIANAKIPERIAVYDADVLTTFTLRVGSRRRVITGVISAEIGIPVTETTAVLGDKTEFSPQPLHEEPLEIAGTERPAETAARGLTDDEQRAAVLLGADHGFSPEQLARAFDVMTRLRAASAGQADIPSAEYLGLLGGEVGVSTRDTTATHRLVGLLDLAGKIFDAEPVSMDEVATLRRLADTVVARPSTDQFRWSGSVIEDGLRAEYLRRELASGPEVTAGDLRQLVRRTLAETLLDGTHGFSGQQLDRVFRLVARLRQRTGRDDASTAEFLRWLGGAVGLHHQNTARIRWTRQVTDAGGTRRLFQLLDVAAETFGDAPVTMVDLTDLRRLGDLITDRPPGGRGQVPEPVTTERLRAEVRAQLDLPRGANVSDAEVRDLVAMMRTAKAARRRAGGGRVRRADLHAAAAYSRTARLAVGWVHEYLSRKSERDLRVRHMRMLLIHLADGQTGRAYLQDAIDVLAAADDNELQAIFADGGNLRARLDMAFIGTGPLRERYNALLLRRFPVTTPREVLSMRLDPS
jgi:hypothetical protein